MEKSIIIIGGGLTGLAAGCYGRMNGYRTSVFEMHDKTGGVATGWKRKGYTVDGAMNRLVGTRPGASFYNFWEELGAAQQWQIFNYEQFACVEYADGVFPVYTDIDRLEQEMIALAPEDEAAIRDYTRVMRQCTRLDMPTEKPRELHGPVDYIRMMKMMPQLMSLRRWMTTSSAVFFKRFKSPLLRRILELASGDGLENMPAFALPGVLAWLHERKAGYVIGGALALMGSIQQRYLDLGGELHLKARVEKILVEGDKAVGVRLADGTEHRGDIVISAADGRTTIFDMLDGKYINDKIRGYYDNLELYPPLVYVGLGVARTFDDVTPSLNGLTFPLAEPVTIAGKELNTLEVKIYNFDPTLAPEGKTVVRVKFNTDYDYWEELHKEPAKYKAEKKRIADTVVGLLDKRFPGLADQVEMSDVATPMTWVRYTGNWKGAYEGWNTTTETFMLQMSKTLPGLTNFYMAGQWVNPGGGQPTAAMSGRHTIQIICKKDKKKFATSTP
jgi:phytoene dehydrogenase-like protein